MKHIKLVISMGEKYQEAFIAELDEMGFEGCQQFDEELFAFISEKDFGIADREKIDHLLTVYPGNNFIQTEQIVEEQNWNRKWEESIQPQVIGPFFVKPTWSVKKAGKDQIVLHIDPKMAFGTGYHATTRLMLKELPHLISTETKVLDAGTGTGILAIAAVKLGAAGVVAFDNDDWSVQNSKENIIFNNVTDWAEVRSGSAEVINMNEKFDIILANINKNVIFEMIKTFQNHLNDKGKLLISGILKSDEIEVKQKLKKAGLKPIHVNQEEEWIAILAHKQV